MTLGPLLIDIEGVALSDEDRDVLAHPIVGGVVLFSRNFTSIEQLTGLTTSIREVRDPPLLIAVDQEGGRVQRFREGFTMLPSPRLLGREYDLDRPTGLKLARQCGWLMAAELRAVAVDLSFAPCVDLDYGVSSVIGDRSFHRDSAAVADLAIAFMGGMREAGMAATAKHFPGHGAVVADTHVATAVDRRPLADMDEDLTPYRRLIANGLPSLMASHVVFPEVDALPTSMSARWLRGELRDGLHFDGAILSDDLAMASAATVGDLAERAIAALHAGCDALSLCNDRKGVLQVIESLRGSGDPVSQLRMARLHGRPGDAGAGLRASEAWRTAERAVRACLERPAFELGP
jgi:beta-N-acetylhexosaminidase